jgi:hypothetical protein
VHIACDRFEQLQPKDNNAQWIRRVTSRAGGYIGRTVVVRLGTGLQMRVREVGMGTARTAWL